MASKPIIQKQAFNRKDAATYLGLSVNTFRKLLDSGEVPYARFGSRLIIPKVGLDNYLSKIVLSHLITK